MIVEKNLIRYFDNMFLISKHYYYLLFIVSDFFNISNHTTIDIMLLCDNHKK